MTVLSHQEVIELASTQRVSVSQVIELIAEAECANNNIKRILCMYGLPELRPLYMSDEFGVSTIENSDDSEIIDTIIAKLGELPGPHYTEQIEYLSMMYSFKWHITTLVQWCNTRKLKVPAVWTKWEKETRPILESRGMLWIQIDETQVHKTATTKRELSKIETKMRNQKLRDLAATLRVEHPRHNEIWIAKRIQKIIDYVLSADSIRKYIREI